MELYDADGNPVEVKSDEELQELETKAKQAEEYETKVKTMEEELTKLKEKDFNFSRFRGKTEEEKKELMKDFTEKEKTLVEEMELLRSEVGNYRETTMSMYEKDILIALAGEDDDLKTKIKEKSKEFVGEVKGKEDMLKRYKEAFTLIKGEVPTLNPINQFVASRGVGDDLKSEKKFTDTDRGKATFADAFPDSPQLKKK